MDSLEQLNAILDMNNFKKERSNNSISGIKTICILVLIFTLCIVYLRERNYSIRLINLSIFQTIFLYLFVIVISSGMMFSAIKIKNSNIFILVALLLPSILLALRYQVGTDYQTYQQLYWLNHHSVDNIFPDLFLKKEGLYIIFCRLLPSTATMIALIGILTLLLTFFATQRLLPLEYVPIAYFLYLAIFYLQSFNIQRQYLAMSLFMVAISYLYFGNRIVYLIFVCLGTGFHQSILIAFPLVFIVNKNGEIKQWILKSRIAAYLILFLGISFLGIILPHIPFLNNYIDYIDSGEDLKNIDNSSFLVYSLIFLYGLFISKINGEPKNYFYIILIIVGIILGFTGFYQQFIKRIALYFFCLEPIFIAEILTKLSEKKSHLWFFLTFFIGLFLFIGIYLIRNMSSVIPYKFF